MQSMPRLVNHSGGWAGRTGGAGVRIHQPYLPSQPNLPAIARRAAMTLVRWSDPFREYAQLQDRINRVFSDAYGRSDEGLMTSGTWVPPVDIFQNGDHEV